VSSAAAPGLAKQVSGCRSCTRGSGARKLFLGRQGAASAESLHRQYSIQAYPRAQKWFLQVRIARVAPRPRQAVAQGRRLRQQPFRQHPDAHEEAPRDHTTAQGRCCHPRMSATVGRTRTLATNRDHLQLYIEQSGADVQWQCGPRASAPLVEATRDGGGARGRAPRQLAADAVTWEKQVLSARGVTGVGRRSEYSICTVWRCVGEAQGVQVNPLNPVSVSPWLSPSCA
jgi:hypothetical protein